MDDADSEYPSLDELEELHELVTEVEQDEDRIENTMKMAGLDKDTYQSFREMYQTVKILENPVTPPYGGPYEAYPGEFMLGTDPEERPVGLSRRELNEHLLVVGRSGAGKTTFFYNLIATCNEKRLPVMGFDFKNDYRHVADDLDLTVVNWREFKFNPLQPPPGVRPGKWGEIMADTFAHATDLLIGSEGYFLEKLRQLYWLYDDEIADGTYPSLFELRDLVDADELHPSSPRFRYKERVLGRLTMMTGFSGEIFDCSRGYPVEALLDENVVFELQEPNQFVTNFVVEALLTWIFYYRDAQGHRQDLRHLILFDEAKRVFDANREEQPESGYPPIDDLMGKVREFGEGLVVADHEPSKLTDSVKANTNAKLWLSLGAGHDTDEMAETFGVEDEEVEFTRTLERGEAVLTAADKEPVPVQLPPYHVDKSTPAIRENLPAVLEALEYRERVRPRNFKDAIGDFSTDGEDADAAEAETAIGEIAEALLASVNAEPFLSMSERYDAIDAGSGQGNDAKEELLKLGLVEEVEIETHRPGRNPKLLDLTDEGAAVLEERGYAVPETGRRGITHRYWQHEIKQFYEDQGFEVEIEHGVGQQHIDVYAERGDESVAVEVACSPEHEVANVEKCLEYGADTVEVACISDDVMEQVEAAVCEEFGEMPDRVAVVSVGRYP